MEPVGISGQVLVVYRDGVSLKIPARSTNLYAAPPDRPVSKLSIDGIRDLLRFAGRSGQHDLGPDLTKSRGPLGGEP
jgi:hypothetical protein